MGLSQYKTLSVQDWLAKVPQRDDFDGNHSSPAPVLSSQHVMYESGEMDFRPDYSAARDYAWAMDVLELHRL